MKTLKQLKINFKTNVGTARACLMLAKTLKKAGKEASARMYLKQAKEAINDAEKEEESLILIDGILKAS
jgi:cellobiose-specific phosphotransferase system component IIA